METKLCQFNDCKEQKINLDDEKDVKFLKWIGILPSETNEQLIKDGHIKIFEEGYAFEGCAIFDTKNNECIVIDYRGL